MKTVSFTRMEDGTAEDYALLESFEVAFMKGLSGRLLRALDGLRGSFDGYQVSRYEHSLQAATRAHRDGRDEEYVVATLLHDIGDELAPYAVRPRDGAPVATPLDWSEVEDRRLKPERFTIKAVAKRIDAGDDPWGPLRGRSLTSPSRLLTRMRSDPG